MITRCLELALKTISKSILWRKLFICAIERILSNNEIILTKERLQSNAIVLFMRKKSITKARVCESCLCATTKVTIMRLLESRHMSCIERSKSQRRFWIKSSMRRKWVNALCFRRLALVDVVIKKTFAKFLIDKRLNELDILFINQDIWNAKKKIKRKRLSKYTSTQILLQSLYRKRWYVKIAFHENIKKIKTLFFVDKNIKNILCKNFEMLVMNCTYKTNRYNMSLLNIVDHIVIEITFYIDFAFIDREKKNRYMWVIEQLKALYKSLDIRDFAIVVIDLNLDLINVLKKFYLDVHVLLCIWHMNKNVKINCKFSFRDDEKVWDTFWAIYERIIYAHKKEDYYETWKNFTTTYSTKNATHSNLYHQNYLYLRHIWIQSWLRVIVKVWINEILHFDTTTISRVEVMHRVLKSHLMYSIDDLKHVIDDIEIMIMNQCAIYTTKLNQESMKKFTTFNHNVFRDVIDRVTSHALYKVENQWLKVQTKTSHERMKSCIKIFKHTKSLSCAHKIKATLNRLHDQRERLNVNDFHSHWRFKKSQTVDAKLFAFRFDYQVIENVNSTSRDQVIDFFENDIWLDPSQFTKQKSNYDFSKIFELVTSLRSNVDASMNSIQKELLERNENVNWKNHNDIEFKHDISKLVKEELVIDDLLIVNDSRVMKFKERSRDVKSKQLSMTRAKKRVAKITKRDLFKFEHVNRALDAKKASQRGRDRDQRARRDKLAREHEDQQALVLAIDDEHSFERITRKKKGTKMIIEVSNDDENFELNDWC